MRFAAIITFFLFLLIVVVLHFHKKKEELVYFYHDQTRMELMSLVDQYYYRDDDKFKKCLICRMYVYDKIVDDLGGEERGRVDSSRLYKRYSLDASEMDEYCAPTENLACF